MIVTHSDNANVCKGWVSWVEIQQLEKYMGQHVNEMRNH